MLKILVSIQMKAKDMASLPHSVTVLTRRVPASQWTYVGSLSPVEAMFWGRALGKWLDLDGTRVCEAIHRRIQTLSEPLGV